MTLRLQREKKWTWNLNVHGDSQKYFFLKPSTIHMWNRLLSSDFIESVVYFIFWCRSLYSRKRQAYIMLWGKQCNVLPEVLQNEVYFPPSKPQAGIAVNLKSISAQKCPRTFLHRQINFLHSQTFLHFILSSTILLLIFFKFLAWVQLQFSIVFYFASCCFPF